MDHAVSRQPLDQTTFTEGIADLSRRDAALAAVVARWGAPPFWTHAAGFPGIVLAVLSQQVSLESAQAAYTKLETAIEVIEAHRFLALDHASLRAIGFSRQKAGYVRGIAQAVVDGSLDFDAFESLNDEEIRDRLIAIKGIGRWTADTYLLFALRRPDAWPTGDLALVKAMAEVKGLSSVPSFEEADALAERWKPWRAVAARILWHGYLSQRGR